jgi:SAM-dependent methyltransferase/uncharacterized protein YbaR (Trm112 family)
VRADLPVRLPLVCLACRTVTATVRNVNTLVLERTLRGADGEVEEGILRCANRACGRRYPILDGVPLLVPDPATYLGSELVGVVEGDFAPEAAALLALAGPDDAPYARLLEHLSIYLDAHWGDAAAPPPDGPAAPHGMAALAQRLAGRAGVRVDSAVELGASVGRGLAELASGAGLTVGIDLSFAALRRARRILRGDRVAYARRQVGRHYAPATLPPRPAVANVEVICGDALDPPLVPASFGRVAALNLIDVVHDPLGLLSVVDGLCAPGGEVLISSPYAWQSSHVGEAHRIGGSDPAGEVVRRLREGEGLGATYAIEDEADIPWALRRDARAAVSYSVHYVRARKRA